MKLVAVVFAAATLAPGQALVEGNKHSMVRVIIFEDLQCPDCASFRRMLDERLLPRYRTTVAFEHRDFPLAKHRWARQAAIAARYFESMKPELAIEFRKRTMDSIRDINLGSFDDYLVGFATRHDVDPEKVKAALADARLGGLVEKDFQEGVSRGVSKTPTVFVNGTPFVETFSFDEISKAIEEELKR